MFHALIGLKMRMRERHVAIMRNAGDAGQSSELDAPYGFDEQPADEQSRSALGSDLADEDRSSSVTSRARRPTIAPMINIVPENDDDPDKGAIWLKGIPPPDEGQYYLVEKAKRNKWAKIDEYLFRKLQKKEKRVIDAADPETGETTLMFACKAVRYLIVERLCELGALVNTRANDRRTALHYAAEAGNEKIVGILLTYHADPNLFGGVYCQLPLHIAAMSTAGNFISDQMLLNAGLKDRTLLLKDGLGNLPITYAVESGVFVLAKEMLQHYPNEQLQWFNDVTGDYLVHIAARNKSYEVMTTLAYDGDADINAQNKDGQTPLHISARIGDLPMVKILLNFKAKPDIIDKKDRAPLHFAAENGHTDIVEILVERFKANVHLRTKDGSTLMHLAADKGYADTVLAFIRQGVPVNMANKTGYLCIHIASFNGHRKVVKTLVKHGSKIDGRTRDGLTALHLAVLNNKPAIIEAILGMGAKVDLKGGVTKETPLHIAARLPEGFHCAEMLLKSGAIVNSTNEETLETALHIAARQGSVALVKLLLEEGANALLRNRAGETVLHIAARHCHFQVAKVVVDYLNSTSLGSKDASNLVNLANFEGETAFHLASELGKAQSHDPFEEVDIIRLLLENGADPLATTSLTQETSLHYCARSGNQDILLEIVHHLGTAFPLACNRQDMMGSSALMTASEQGHATVSNVLLANGARADVFDEHGKAALHLAAENGHVDCCEVLLTHKAFVNAKSKLGITPLHLAAQNGFRPVVQFLVERFNATVNARALDQKTPLHLAAKAGRKDVCQMLLNLQAEADAIDAFGQAPLHLAAENDHVNVVECFIKYRPNLITTTGKGGMTCAHIAANNGAIGVIRELARFNKALVTSVKSLESDSLPLHLAVTHGHRDVVRALIYAGSSATSENSEGMTAIHLAAREGNSEVLQSIPPKISLRTISLKNGLSAIHVAAFYGKAEIVRDLQSRVDLNTRTNAPQAPGAVIEPKLRDLISNDFGLTPLHLASYMGHEHVVRLILNSPNVFQDEVSLAKGRMALSYAAQCGHLITVSILMSRSAKQLRAKDGRGRQPLHLAARGGHFAMCEMLLAQGGEVNAVDNDGWTALHFATKHGFIKVAQLLINSGASPMMKTKDGKTALMLSANGLHLDQLNYLLTKEHDSDYLMSDKDFLLDLMLCGRTNKNASVNRFVLDSEAPLYTTARLANLYRQLAIKVKERAKDMNDVARHCENMTTDLLAIAATVAPASTILRATDSKGNQFLDILIENNMKDVVSNGAVQRYLSDIWAGRLSSWPSWSLFLLFLGFLLFPPLCIYICLPFKHHHYHHIPVIKFLAMIVSHLYLIGLFTIVAAIPVDPLIYRDNFYPNWHELLCLAWVSGMLVAELTRRHASSGLGMLRYAIIVFTVFATLFQLAAIVVDFDNSADSRNLALTLMYLRNCMLSFSLFSSIILILDFFQMHHRFGPFGVIISNVLRDLMTFIVIMLLFAIAFSVLIVGLFSPVQPADDGGGSENSTEISLTVNKNTSNSSTISGTDLLLNGTTVEPRFLNGSNINSTLHRIKRDVGNSAIAKSGQNKCRQAKRQRQVAADFSGNIEWMTNFTADENLVNNDYSPPTLSNNSPDTLVFIFWTLYFSMFAMGDIANLPTIESGPPGSQEIFLIYYGFWLITAVIVLVPLLIAMLTDTYKKIHIRADLEWKFGRAKLVSNMIKLSAAPAPLNLIVRPYLYLRSIHKHGRMMCSKYAQFLIDEDEHEAADDEDEGMAKKSATGDQKNTPTTTTTTPAVGFMSRLFGKISPTATQKVESDPKIKNLPPDIVNRLKERKKVAHDHISRVKTIMAPKSGDSSKQKGRRRGLQLMSQALDWSTVVRRYEGQLDDEQPLLENATQKETDISADS